MTTFRSLYLGTYNMILFFGWLHILYLTIQSLLSKGPAHVYSSVEKSLQIWQTAAILEIINSATGIVKSPVLVNLPQIGSRIFLVWPILYIFKQSQSHILVTSLLLSWSITEIIRYSFFALKETVGFSPKPLVWLRYSTFLLLYPSGILSEVGLIFISLPYIKSSSKFNISMPNFLNFGFDFYIACIVILFLYLPGGPFMYTYMIGQRKKVLGKKEKSQ